MHLRRAVLLFGLVVGLAAIVAAVAPKPKSDTLLQAPATPPAPQPVSAPTARVSISLAAERRVRRHVPPGAHLILTVEVADPGDVSFLGSVQAAEPGTPAVFDLVMPRSGSFAVELSPSGGGSPRGATVSVSG
jgi:hypothetical protein